MSTEAEWGSLKGRLEASKQALAEEIRRYPPPIPACDAQYNHLLEQRQLLTQELARLDVAAQDQTITISDFIRSSPCDARLLT